MARRTVQLDLNRVEGDLEIQVDLEDDVIVDARCIGTLYRGFEQILIGRAPRDPLQPRLWPSGLRSATGHRPPRDA